MSSSRPNRRGGARLRTGFTLVELLIVIAIVAVLLSIMLPSLRRAREDARRTACIARLKHVGVGLFAYAAVNRDLGPRVMAPNGDTSPRILLSEPDSLVNMGLAWPGDVRDADLFYCPSQTRFPYNRDPQDLQRDFVSGSYAYAVHVPATQSPRFSGIRHLALVSDDFVAIEGDAGAGRFAHRNGYNVLYVDGSAAWYPDPDESIWKRGVGWDDETDEYTYESLYGPSRKSGGHHYYGESDIFRVWHAFCYSRPDPF